MKKWVLAVMLAVSGLAVQAYAAPTTQVDALIEKLIDKGILTKDEAEGLKGQIANDAGTLNEAAAKKYVPEWAQNLKVSGDFRLRDQFQRRTNRTAANDFGRNRVRIRARLNFEDQINDKVKIVAGISTDGNSPRSNNQTLGGNTTANDTFGKAGATINKAYAVYTPNDKITLMGGKMDNPIWEPANLLWDPDITPEGGAIQLQEKLNSMVTPFGTGAVLVLHDQSPSSAIRTDPYMIVGQGGIKGNLTEKTYYKLAGTYYGINNPSHTQFTNNSGTNTPATTSSTLYSYNFENVVGGVEMGVNDPFEGILPSPIYIPQVGAFGEYAVNLDPAHNNRAWMMGGYIGNSKIGGWGTWRLQSYFKVLERDAWLDSLPDDDFYGGLTDTAGWRSQLDIGLAKNVWLTVTYLRTHVYKVFSSVSALNQKAPESVFQTDVNFKF